jgi:GNAT superfamily N-acetyltransferase
MSRLLALDEEFPGIARRAEEAVERFNEKVRPAYTNDPSPDWSEPARKYMKDWRKGHGLPRRPSGTRNIGPYSAREPEQSVAQAKVASAFLDELEKTAASKTLREVVTKANEDPWIKDTVLTTGGKRRRTISHHGKVVGFMTPRRVGGVLRLGPVYVRPEYRGQGYASEAIRKATAKTPSRAIIDRGNRSSIRAFTAAGFVKVKESGDELVFEKNIGVKKTAELDPLVTGAVAGGAILGASAPRTFDPTWLHPTIVRGSPMGRTISALLGAGTAAGIASLPSAMMSKDPEEDPEEEAIQSLVSSDI